MGYALLALLSVELIVFYLCNGRNVVSPSFLACASFILATCIYLTGDEYYRYELHFNTVAVIGILLFCIFCGEMFAKTLRVKSVERITQTVPIVSINVCVIIGIGVLGLSLLRFYEVYRFSLLAGNKPGNFWTMAKYVREAKLGGTLVYNPSIFASQGVVISMCALFFSVYCLCANRELYGKTYYRYIFPMVCYLPQVFASDDRTGLLRVLTVCAIIVFVFVKQKHKWTSKGNLKIIFASLVLVILFFMIFRWLGYRTETSLRSEAWDNITEYTSAGLVGLDKYLQKGETPNVLFGQWTLKSIYMILRQWGLQIPQVDRFEKFFTYAKGEANIYTGFKPYIKDYTMIGAGFAMFLWGAVISCGMKYIQKNGAGFIRLCWMGMMYYPVIILSMDDTTSTVLSITTLYTFFYLFALDWFFISQKIRIRWKNG